MISILKNARILKCNKRLDGMGIALIEPKDCSLIVLIHFKKESLLESKVYVKTQQSKNRVFRMARKDFLEWKDILMHRKDTPVQLFDEILLQTKICLS